jgi:hypothetical protein
MVCARRNFLRYAVRYTLSGLNGLCRVFCRSWIRSFSRQKLEEAIAALLVLPCSQNLLIQRNSLDTLPVNALPVDSLLYVSRHLGRLCAHYVVVWVCSVRHHVVTARQEGLHAVRKSAW